MPLTAEEREAFLGEAHVASFAVGSGERGRGPVNVPVWYAYRPGGYVMVITGRASRKARLAVEAGRFALLVGRTVPSYRYVSVEGEVVSVTTATEEEVREVGSRYLPTEEAVAGYVGQVLADPGAAVAIRMRPRRWLSADLGASG